MQEFHCDICGVERSRDEGAGLWFTLGLNSYGPPEKRRHKLHVYGWPLGCNSKEDGIVQHACSVSHMLELVSRWASTTKE